MTDAGPPAPGVDAPIGHRATRALLWSFLNTALGRFGTIAINIVLARALGPEAFGTFAVALIALLAVLSLNDLGVSLAIVRWQEDPRHIAPTVTSISFAMSVVLAAAMAAAASPVAHLTGAPDAASVIQVMAIGVLIDGLTMTPAALLQREFRQRRRFLIDQVNTWLGSFTALGLALFGFGAMSLAIGRLTGSIAALVLFLRASPLPLRFGWDRDQVRPLLNFGLPLAGASLVVFGSGYADQVTIGALLGPVTLGLYTMAFNLSGWPLALFSAPLRAVAPALFARMQSEPERMTRAFAQLLGALVSVVTPACIALSATAGPIVLIVYGAAWAPAALALQWLGLSALARIVFELCYDYLVVVRASTAVLVAQVCWVAALIPAVIVAAPHGLAGVALAQTIVAVALMLPIYLVLLARVGVRPGPMLRRLVVPLGVGALQWVGCRLIVDRMDAPWAAVGLSAVVSAAALLALGWRSWPELRELRRLGG